MKPPPPPPKKRSPVVVATIKPGEIVKVPEHPVPVVWCHDMTALVGSAMLTIDNDRVLADLHGVSRPYEIASCGGWKHGDEIGVSYVAVMTREAAGKRSLLRALGLEVE